MSINAEKMMKVVIDGKDVFIPADSSIQKFVKVTFKGRDSCMTEEDGITLRDALLRVLPLAPPQEFKNLATEIKSLSIGSDVWKLVDGVYRKGDQSISRVLVDRVLSTFKTNEELDGTEVSIRLAMRKTSHITNALAALAQCGKLVKRKDKLRALYRLKQFEYKPPAGLIKIDSATSEEVLQGIKASQKKDLEAMRER